MTRETLLLVTLQSSVLFALLWAIFRLAPRIPANAKAWLWRLAFLKPLLSLLPFAAITLNVVPEALPTPAPKWDLPPTAPPRVIYHLPPRSAQASVQAPVAEPERPKADPLLLAWALGVAVSFGFGLLGVARSLKIAREAEEVDRADLRYALQSLLWKADIRRPVRLLSSKSIPNAVLLGGRRYAIALPRKAVESGDFQDLRLMLAHEVAHIARRDMVWLALSSLAHALFFFNPMAWVAARCSRLDHESATDHYAARLAEVPIKTYAAMLLRATVVTRAPLAPGGLPVAESYRTIHRRLQAMKHFNTKPTWKRKTATATLALLTLSLLPAYRLAAVPFNFEEKPTPTPSPTKKQDPAPRATIPVAPQAKSPAKATPEAAIPEKTAEPGLPTPQPLEDTAPAPTQNVKPSRPIGDLLPGAKAPAIKVAEWLKGAPVTRYEKGKLYVVEFWIGENGPTISGLAKAYKTAPETSNRVEFIALPFGFWENVDRLREFVEEAGDRMDYLHVARDDDSASMQRVWLGLVAPGNSGKKGIILPYSYLVNGDGTILWMGSSRDLKPALDQALAGNFDFDFGLAARQLTAERATDDEEIRRMVAGIVQMRDDSYRAVRLNMTGKRAEALQLLAELESKAKNDSDVVAAGLVIRRREEPVKVDLEIDKLIDQPGKHDQDVVNSVVNMMHLSEQDAVGRELVEKMRKKLTLERADHLQWVRLGGYWQMLYGDAKTSISDYENAKKCMLAPPKPTKGMSFEMTATDLDEKIAALKKKIAG